MKQLTRGWAKALLSLAILSAPITTWAANYMPFILGNITAESVAKANENAKLALQSKGFEVVGEYSPNNDTHVFVVTNQLLKTLASRSKYGGFGAMARVSITKKSGHVHVSYTNPTYMWNAYRMEGDITRVQKAMQEALGVQKAFGAERPLSAESLRNYRYKMMMPYFDDQIKLAQYRSHQEAINQVEAGLESGRAGATKVYRIDIPGSKMSVFGVALTNGEAADSYIISKIDGNAHSHAAHFPYELLVVEGEVTTLNGHFRIALNWPSLSMMGAGSFMSISHAPDHITTALESVANNRNPSLDEALF